MIDHTAPRMRLSVERWSYHRFHEGIVTVQCSYQVENCTDEDIDRLVPIVSAKRWENAKGVLTEQTWKRFERYPNFIMVKSVYEVNGR